MEVSRRHLLPRERASESQGWRARARVSLDGFKSMKWLEWGMPVR